MTAWVAVAVLGGLVGLDGTSFPQAMFSRPLVAGALTGAIFGRPIEGIVLGFIMEAFALVTLPIGAARYPESGTATVAGTAALLAASPPGINAAAVTLAVLFALAWERLAGATVVLQRRRNGRSLASAGTITAEQLERRHLAAMTMDFVRGAVVSSTGGLIGYALVRFTAPHWALPGDWTMAALGVLTAAMVGCAVPLFGGLKARRVALAGGLGAGLLAALVLP